jgi:hypothetical protein
MLGVMPNRSVPADAADFDPGRIISVFDAHGVEYLIVGGFGAQAHGAHRQTWDIDLVPLTTHENQDWCARRRWGSA